MPSIRPIDAICFGAALHGSPPRDISAHISPPYDVLTQQDKDRLLAKNPRNIVAVDLAHYPPSDAGPPETYEAAARQFRGWLDKGVLRHLGPRALFLYEQEYEFAGNRYV